MTKRQAIQRKTEWIKALAEGRVVRFGEGERLTSYATNEQAARAVITSRSAGIKATIVQQ